MTVDGRGRIATSGRLPAAATALVVLAASMWPVTAAASDTGTWTGLLAAIGGCGGTTEAPTTVTLAGDISEPSGTLTVGCALDLDLGGHDLAVRDVVIDPGKQLTIMDSGGGGVLTADAANHSQVVGIRTTGAALVVRSGTVIATGGYHSAGIGGGLGGAGGSVTIAGGTVTAFSTQHGAGIGGGQGGAGGPVSISGGTVTATGTGHAAGIGGGYQGAGGTVSITGGTVTATGIGQAAGIGGALDGAGGDVQIAAGAVVTATGGQTAIGAGGASSPFGSLTLAGTLHLPDGNMIIPTGVEVPVAATGRILGSTNDPTVGANITGGGRIANGGVIGLAPAHVTAGGVTVSGHHYAVTFDAAGGTPEPGHVVVYASTFTAGLRDLPAAPTRGGGLAFGGWTDQPDGAGTPIDATSTLPGSSADGVPVAITAHAVWRPTSDATASTITADPTSITANGTSTSTITVQARDAAGNNWTAGGDTVALTTSAGTLSEVHDNNDGTYTATLTSATTATTATITGVLNGTSIDDDATVRFTTVSSPTPTDPDPDGGVEAPVFDDVPEDSVHADAIDRVVRFGIAVGDSETTFDPAGELSRGQMATFLVRLLALTDPRIEQPADHDAATALLAERGLLLGHVDGNLDGAGALTRGQAASLLVRLLEQVTGEVLPASRTQFSDVASTGTHAEDIGKLVEPGVVEGYVDGTYRPGTGLRRDQMASLISRALDVLIGSGHIEDRDT